VIVNGLGKAFVAAIDCSPMNADGAAVVRTAEFGGAVVTAQ
jgi:hypothetical protein